MLGFGLFCLLVRGLVHFCLQLFRLQLFTQFLTDAALPFNQTMHTPNSHETFPFRAATPRGGILHEPTWERYFSFSSEVKKPITIVKTKKEEILLTPAQEKTG